MVRCLGFVLGAKDRGFRFLFDTHLKSLPRSDIQPHNMVRSALLLSVLLLGTLSYSAEARRRTKGAAAASSFVEDDDLNVMSDDSLYDVNDPAAAHAEVGMKRANDDDLDGAIEAFRAQLKHDQHKANAHNNLGVTLLRMGNSRDAETARRMYYQALTNFQSSLQQGNGGAQDNIDAIHQNCKIRYSTNCGEAFAAFTGGVGAFSDDDDEGNFLFCFSPLFFFPFFPLFFCTNNNNNRKTCATKRNNRKEGGMQCARFKEKEYPVRTNYLGHLQNPIIGS